MPYNNEQIREMLSAGSFHHEDCYGLTADTREIITKLLDREDEIKRKIEGMTSDAAALGEYKYADGYKSAIRHVLALFN